MLRRSAGSLLIALCWLLTPGLHADDKPTAADKKGKFISENVYTNPALGMTITLPGTWQFFEKEAQETLGIGEKAPERKPNQDCRGPFCAGTDLDVAILSKELRGSIFLIAYKLSPEYLDRQRYPLKRFAEAMAKNSLGGTDWIMDGDLTLTELDTKPAYRLLVHKPLPLPVGQGRGFGYVGESNGYVFLLVGSVPDLHPDYPKDLQAALESMTLTSATASK
jgi:hypothetical protein